MDASTETALTIDLKDGRTVYAPGEQIEGSLRFALYRAPGTIELRLGWYASSAAETDIMCHCAEQYCPADKTGCIPFQVVLPIGPLTHQGRLFAIKWLLEARIRRDKLLVQVPLMVQA